MKRNLKSLLRNIAGSYGFNLFPRKQRQDSEAVRLYESRMALLLAEGIEEANRANLADVAAIFERSLEEFNAHYQRVAHGILAEIDAELAAEAKCARS